MQWSASALASSKCASTTSRVVALLRATNVLCDCLPSAAGGAGARCPRCDAYQASLESGNPLVPVPLRLSSRPAARARRGPDRGALGPFANQKNRRAQNDLGRSPP